MMRAMKITSPLAFARGLFYSFIIEKEGFLRQV